MNARELIELAQAHGTNAVQAELGCTQRQAKMAVIRARRSLATGEPFETEDVQATVAAAYARRASTAPPATPEKNRIETEPPVSRSEALERWQQDQQREYILQKNVNEGYREWQGELDDVQARLRGFKIG